MRLSVKFGVLCACAALSPFIVVFPIVLYQVSAAARAHAEEKLQTRLRGAESVYDKRLAEMLSAAQRLAADTANRALVIIDNASRDSASALARLHDMLAHSH